MLTAPTWTYSAAGGPNPFIVPARGGFVAAAINTESGATIVGLGRKSTRFSRPLKLENRGVAIFAQPAPGTLPERAWAIGYSTAAGVAPRLIGIARDGEITTDIARPEVSWREGRAIAVTEVPGGPILHVDDKHLVLDSSGHVITEVPRPGSDAVFTVEGGRLYAFDGGAVAVVDLTSGRTLARIPVDGRPQAIRVDMYSKRLAVRLDRVLLSLDLGDLSDRLNLRALVGGLFVSPSTHDSNLRTSAGSPAALECVDDDGAPRWSLVCGGASSVFGAGFLAGGEVLATTTQAAGDRVIIVRDGQIIFERPRAGAITVHGTLARVGDRVALCVPPGASPGVPLEFGSAVDVATMRGGGAIVYERPGSPHARSRMFAVDPAGAPAIEVTEGGAGARWAVWSEGLIAVPRTNSPRIDLYDSGAPA